MPNENIGHFGAAVIGEDQREREKQMVQSEGGPNATFGPAVLDHPESEEVEEPAHPSQEEVHASDEAKRDELPPGYEVETKGFGWVALYDPDGDLVDGPSPGGYFEGTVPAQEAAWEDHLDRDAEEASDDEEPQAAIVEIQELLEANPAEVDRVMNAEFQRAEGPREEVLRLIGITELEREGEDYPRPEIMNVLEDFRVDLPEQEGD